MWDSNVSQEQVYRDAVQNQNLPQHLCQGYHCTLIAYGASGTGKTHTLLGAVPGDDDAYSVADEANVDQTTTDNSPTGQRGAAPSIPSNKDNAIDNGLVMRMVNDVFEILRGGSDEASTNVEVTIRCSVVEVYLERIRDLLWERDVGDAAREGNHVRLHAPSVGAGPGQGALFEGATALSCVSPTDIRQALLRARAVRTCSAAHPNRDSSRSTLVVQLVLEQYDRIAGRGLQSRLLVVDLAASDLSPLGESARLTGTTSSRSRPLWTKALEEQIRECFDSQLRNAPIPYTPPPESPVLCRLLSHSLMGGNSYTSLCLQVSASQEWATETVQTLQFGTACRRVENHPVINVYDARWQDDLQQRQEIEAQQQCWKAFAHALADECQRLRSKASHNHLFDRKLWSLVEELQSSSGPASSKQPLHFTIETKEEREVRRDLMKLRSSVRRTETERDEARSKALQLQSDLAILASEHSRVRNALDQLQSQADQALEENRRLQQLNAELQLNLRTSLFRESEAVVFLRQFRKFYVRLLKQQAAQGRGDMNSILQSVPGAPDLSNIVDLDRIMFESGILESDEVGVDGHSKLYRPSGDALARSAQVAALAERDALQNEQSNPSEAVRNISPDLTGVGICRLPLSVVERSETGECTEARQKLYQTPSGRYVELREQVLEAELLEVSNQCRLLEEELNKERMRASLQHGDGTVAAGAIEEIETLKRALARRDKDVNAVIWKMNELHLSGKLFREKVESREPHIAYLEDAVAATKNSLVETLREREFSDRQYREELSHLRQVATSIAEPTWHSLGTSNFAPRLEARLVVPINLSSRHCSTPQRRHSNGEIETLMERISKSRDVPLVDAETQTELAENAAAVTPASRGVARLASHLEPDDFLFMDDDSVGDSTDHRSLYGGLMEPYNIQNDSKQPKDVLSSSSHSASPFLILSALRHESSAPQFRSKTKAPFAPNESPASLTSSLHSTSSRSIVATDQPHVPPIVDTRKHEARSDAYEVNDQMPDALWHEAPSLAIGADSKVADRSEKKENDREASTAQSSMLPSRTDHSTTSFATHTSRSQDSVGKTAGLSSFLSKYRKEVVENEADDEKSSTPEFMKLFKRIGFKQSEEVIETQGAAAVRELTRTAYGENAIRTEKGVPDKSSQFSSTNTKKWVPRKKKGDDSDSDDSFARKFLGSQPQDSDSDEESDKEDVTKGADEQRKAPDGGDNDESDSDDDESKTPPILAPSSMPSLPKTQNAIVESDSDSDEEPPKRSETLKSSSTTRQRNDSDSDDSREDEKPKTPPWKKKGAAPPPPPEAIGSPWKKSTATAGSTWRSGDLSPAGSPLKGATSTQATGSAGIQNASAAPAKSNATSDSDEDSDDERPKTPPWKRRAPAPVVPTKPPASAGSDSDTDSEEDEKPKTPPWKKKGAAPPPPPPMPSYSVRPVSPRKDDSHARAVEQPVASQSLKSIPVAPAFGKGSSSDSDSESDDEQESRAPSTLRSSLHERSQSVAPTTPGGVSSENKNEKVPLQGSTIKTTPATTRDDSEEESSSDDEDDKPPTAAIVQPPKRVDSDDESSSDDEDGKPQSVSTAQPSKPAQPPRQADSDEDESSDDENHKIASQKEPVRSLRAVSQSTKAVSVDSDDESSEDETETSAQPNTVVKPVVMSQPVKPVVVSQPVVPAEDDSSDDSSDEESRAPVVTARQPQVPTIKPAPPQATAKPSPPGDDSDDSSSEDESEGPSPHSHQAPTSHPQAKAMTKTMSTSQDDSSEDEDVPPPPKAVPKAQVDSDSESSDEEPPRSAANSAPTPTPSPAVSTPQPLPQASQSAKPSLATTATSRTAESTESDDSDDDSSADEAAPPPKSDQASHRAAKDTAGTGRTGGDGNFSDDGSRQTVKAAPNKSPAKPLPDPPQEDILERIRNKLSTIKAPDAATAPQQKNEAKDDDDEDDDDDESEEEDSDPEEVGSGKPEGFVPTRKVPDYGAQVTPSVTQAANHKGGWSDSKKEKAKFVIRNGRLVKSDASSVVSEESNASSITLKSPKKSTSKKGSSSTSVTSATSASSGASPSKGKFVIRDGKLVKDDSAIVSGLSLLSTLPQGQMERRNSLDSKTGDVLEKEDRKGRRAELTLKMEPSSPRKKSGSGGKVGAFVIKDGKLVKAPPPSSSSGSGAASAPSKPAFSIVNGKLVKNDGPKSSSSSSTPASKSRSSKSRSSTSSSSTKPSTSSSSGADKKDKDRRDRSKKSPKKATKKEPRT